MRNSDKNPSLVVAHEFKKSNFSDGNIDNMKQLLEGSGGVIEHKGVDPITAYHGSNFFLCSQYVHSSLLAKREEVEDETWFNFMALKARIKLFKFKVAHPYSNKHSFPLDAGKIAVLLKHYAGQCVDQEAVVQMPTQAIFTQNPNLPNPQNPNVISDPSLNIRAPAVASPNILNAPLEEDIPLQARLDRKRAADTEIA